MAMSSRDVTAPCRMAPDDTEGTHECLAEEMRCAYCGCRLNPYPCNGCGKFLTAERMHEEIWRCEDCGGG